MADGPGWRRSFFFIFPPVQGRSRSSSGPALSFAGSALTSPCANAQKITVGVVAIFYGNRRGGRELFRLLLKHQRAVVAGGSSTIEDSLFISPSCSTPDRSGYLPLAGRLFRPSVSALCLCTGRTRPCGPDFLRLPRWRRSGFFRTVETSTACCGRRAGRYLL